MPAKRQERPDCFDYYWNRRYSMYSRYAGVEDTKKSYYKRMTQRTWCELLP